MADNLEDNFFEVDYFMPIFLKGKYYKMKAITVTYKEVYRDK